MKPTLTSISRLRVLAAAIVACAMLNLGTVGRAAAQPAIDASVISGVDQDMTAISRLSAGGLYGFGKTRLAVEAHLGFDFFLRIDKSQGIASRSFNLLDLGVRYGIQSDRFVGPYVTTGANFGVVALKPNERKSKDPDVCETAEVQDQCNFKIDKNISFRLGFGWGFAASKKTTVGVRLDVNYWLLSVAPWEEQLEGAPIPRHIPRPQDSWSFMLGLEFMRWR